jgi:hypothetical protein
MKAKKSTPKQIVWPPRMMPKRKRALALLQEWADKRVELEYSVRAGVTFTGTISQLSFDKRRTSFLSGMTLAFMQSCRLIYLTKSKSPRLATCL